MMWAAVTWNAERWVVPVACIGMAFCALVLWSYAQSSATRGLKLTAGVFKMIAVSLLLLCLLEPLISGIRPRPGANQFAVLIDTSRSMRVDREGVPTADEFPRWFGGGDGKRWRARLEQDFDVRLYRFDRDVRQIESPDELRFDGEASNLVGALETLSERYRNRPLAGVLVVTDGNATDLNEGLSAQRLPACPLYPVWTESTGIPTDIRIHGTRISQTHFETSPTTIDGSVVADGYSGRSIVVQLVDESDDVVEEQSIKVDSNGFTAPFHFRFRPEKGGLRFYQLRVVDSEERDAFAEGKSRHEATIENNLRTLPVRRGGGPFRILYVAGRPNWEFKFLRRSLAEDDELQLVSLLRIARKEPKFQFRDQGGTGDANRLFEGFDDDEMADAENYDEPVFVRIDVAGSRELANGFPSNAESLFLYDAVILDDLEASFFSPDQMLLLRRYVSQRGGGLLMLGGVSSFAQGGYARTPIGEMLPVYLKRTDERSPAGRVRLRLTREGMLETWTRLRETAAEEQRRLGEMPGFYTLNAIGDLKPGAIAVAECVDGDGARPAIVTQRFGKGRSTAVMLGDLWRWSLERNSADDTDLNVFWRQLLRAVVADVPQRVEVDIEQGAAGQSTEIHTLVRTAEFLPDDNASVEITVQPPRHEAVTLTAEPSDSRAGVYVTSYWPREPGGYRVAAKVTGGDGTLTTGVNHGWVFAPDEKEFDNLAIHGDVLRQLSAHRGGRSIHPAEIGQFVAQLQRQPVPVTDHWVAPLWHQAWVFGLALVCLCMEWGLRRWKGLT